MEKIKKVYSWCMNHLFITSIFIFIILAFLPLIINLSYCLGDAIKDNAIKTYFDASDILSYAGNIISSLIAGIATFVVLQKTIQFERVERNKDRRLQIYPYIIYEVIHETCDHEIEEFNLHPDMKYVPHEYKYDLIFYLILKNIGINSAINFTVLETDYCGMKDLTNKELGDISVNETKYLRFNVLINANDTLNINKGIMGVTTINMKIAYTNITQDYYEQTIKIDCQWNLDEKISFGDGKKYSASIGKNSVSKPQYYKNKNIKVEIKKRLDNFLKKDK